MAAKGSVRAAFFGLMGKVSNDALPAPLPREKGYWLKLGLTLTGAGFAFDEDEHERLLRPDWNAPWAINKIAWLLEVVKRIRSHGAGYSNHLTHEVLAKVPLDTMTKVIETIFTSLADRYKIETAKDGGLRKKKKTNSSKRRQRKERVSNRH